MAEALHIYQKIAQHPQVENRLEISRRLAMIQDGLGLKEEAITNYRKVLREDPDAMDIVTAWQNSIDREESEEGLKYLDMVIKAKLRRSKSPQGTLYRRRSQTKLNRHPATIETYLKVFSMGVEDPTS